MKFTFVSVFVIPLLFVSIAFSQTTSPLPGKSILREADSLLFIDADASIGKAKSVLQYFGDNDTLFVDATFLLAQAYREKRIYDSVDYYANICLQKALELQDTVNIIYSYTNLGSDYYLIAEYAKALNELKKSETYYKAFGTERETDKISPLYYAKLLNNMATAYIKTAHYDSSLRCFIESIKIKEANHAAAGTLIVSKINIGSIYLAIKDYANGEVWLKEALADATYVQDSVYMARCYANLGVLYKKTGDTSRAIVNYKKALGINESRGDHRNQAIVLQNLALLLSSQKKYREAHAYFIRALDNNNTIHANNSRLHLAISRMFVEQQMYDSSIVHSQLSLQLSRQNGNIDVLLEDYELLAKAHKEKKQFHKAYNYIEKYVALKDSITNNKNQKYIQNLKTEFETERKENEIVFLKELNQSEHAKSLSIQSKQRLTIIVVLLALLLIIVVALLYFAKKKKEKELYLMEKQLLETNLKNKELESNKLQMEVNFKARQLTTHALNMLQNNQLLEDVQKKLNVIATQVDDELSMKFNAIVKEIGVGRRTEKDWELFKNYFENINKGFMKNLRAINPKLSTHDCRLAALTSLNLNIKETASLLSISPSSVKIARYRLRKRLKLEKGEDLYAFLNKLKI